tara:strand:+ start:1978 stop:2562 length:585 start_codon:yes stop_codon:yes gene_type:complete
MIKVVDNLISKKYQDKIINTVNDNYFPWYFYETILSDEKIKKASNKNITLTPAFVHTLFILPKGINSNYYNFFIKILDTFNVKEIIRIRIRRTFKQETHSLKKYNYPHVDIDKQQNYKSLVYYVEDSDGDTVFFDKKYKLGCPTFINSNYKEIKRVSPKKGRAIYFDGEIYHAGNNPVNSDIRTIINFDFTTNE